MCPQNTDPDIPQDELEEAARLLLHWEGLDKRRRQMPWEWYEPSTPGRKLRNGLTLGRFANQLAFHRSQAIYRLLNPGNGWGKSYSMFQEANAWGRHTNEWAPTPTWPVIMVWFAPSFDQFEIIRTEAEVEIFGPDVKFSDWTYTWPDGSQLFVASFANPKSWKNRMGIPADIIFFDEPPPLNFWEEMTMRRRGRRQTRYVIGATMVEPEHWTEQRLFRPWMEHFKAQGVTTEEDALFAQLSPKYRPHPTTFIWHRGGVEDNPGQKPGDVTHYDDATKDMHPELRRVRRGGGWGNWRGSCIFSAPGIKQLRDELPSQPEPKTGMLVCLPEHDEFGQEARPMITDLAMAQPADLIGRAFGVMEGVDWPAHEGMAKLNIFHPPQDGHTYVIGADFAHARPGGDYDALAVYDKTAQVRAKDGRAVQAATLVGKWGPLFAPVLYGMLRLYKDAFLLGEFQGGGDHVMSQLWHHFDYRYIYIGDKTDEGHLVDAMPVNPQLGWFAHANDIVWTHFRNIVARKAARIACKATIEQMSKVIWAARSSMIGRDGQAAPDSSYKISLSGGGSPDLTIANGYGLWALEKVVHFEKPVPRFPPGSIGDIFQLDKEKPHIYGAKADADRARRSGKRPPPERGGWVSVT